MAENKSETFHLRTTDSRGGCFCLNASIVKGKEVYISPCFLFDGFKNKRKSSLHDTGRSHIKWDFKKQEWEMFPEERKVILSKQTFLSEPHSLSGHKGDEKLIACQNITIHESALHTNQTDASEKSDLSRFDLNNFNAAEFLFVTHLYKTLRTPEEQGFEVIRNMRMLNKTLTVFAKRINLTGKEKFFESLTSNQSAVNELQGPPSIVGLEGQGGPIVSQLFVSNIYLLESVLPSLGISAKI